MFYNGFQIFFMCFVSVSSAFRRILQLLYLDVSKVDRVLHLSSRFLLARLSVTSSSQCRLGIRRPLLLFLDAGDVWGSASPTWARETAWASGRSFI
jgi:hypothetical protein